MKIIYLGFVCVLILIKEALSGGDSVSNDNLITIMNEEKIVLPTMLPSVLLSTTTSTSIPENLTTMSTSTTTLTMPTTMSAPSTTLTSIFGVGRPTKTKSIEALSTTTESITTESTAILTTTTLLSIPVTITNLAPEDQPLEKCIISPSGEVINKGGDCFSSCGSEMNLSLYHIDDSKVLCCCKEESN